MAEITILRLFGFFLIVSRTYLTWSLYPGSPCTGNFLQKLP